MGTRVLRLLGFALILSCGDGPVDRLAHLRAPPPVPSTPTPPPLPATPAGPLATRVEAQESFDRARSALLRGDFLETARQVEWAAAFMRSHAEEAGPGVVAALQGAAKELDVLAERLQNGAPPTVRTLDRVFANANRAEAQHHLARVVASLGKPDRRATGEELLMAVDHLERSAQYLRQPNGPRSANAFSEARLLATRLVAGEDPGRGQVKRVLAPLEAELQRLCRTIDQEAEACAVEQPLVSLAPRADGLPTFRVGVRRHEAQNPDRFARFAHDSRAARGERLSG